MSSTTSGILPVFAPDATSAAILLNDFDDALRCPRIDDGPFERIAVAQEMVLQALAIDDALAAATLPKLRESVRRYAQPLVATNAALWKLTKKRSDLPQWKVVKPPSFDRLVGIYTAEAKRSEIGWQYLAAINFAETKFGRVRGVSSTGARGPMQFMPRTWKAFGSGDIENDADAIRAAAKYLSASGAPANMQKALFAYNHLQAYVDLVDAVATIAATDQTQLRAMYYYRPLWRTAVGPVLISDAYKAPSVSR